MMMIRAKMSLKVPMKSKKLTPKIINQAKRMKQKLKAPRKAKHHKSRNLILRSWFSRLMTMMMTMVVIMTQITLKMIKKRNRKSILQKILLMQIQNREIK